MNTYDLKYLSIEQEPYKLWPEDIKLFEEMKEQYSSEEERLFFEKMKLKMEYECAPSGDDIMIGRDNEDGMYICRLDLNEFVIGRYTGEVKHIPAHGFWLEHESQHYVEYHAMNLSEALSHNLKDIIGKDITLLDWLRKRNYCGIDYNGNVAYN